MINYIPLELKTSYSILESLNKINDTVKKAKEYNYKALAITDHNNMFGVMEFYLECLKNNIKPIIGIKLDILNGEILLYAKNNNGYKNLIKLSTLISDRNLTIQDLTEYKNDLILVLPYKYYNKEIYDIYETKFIGYSTIEEKGKITEPKVFINNISYLSKDDYKYIDYLYMIREGKIISEYTLETSKNNYMYKKEEVELFFGEEDSQNYQEIIDTCNVTIEYQEGLLPIYRKDIDSKKYLHELSYKGLNKRLNNNIPLEYQKRIDYELSIIDKMGFNDYFLIVYDYVLYSKKHNILVGPGRGSAAGSLVSYSLGITEVDPIKYGLLFERFLNPERVTMPDIDVDFDANKRDEVIEYVTNKYGSKKVAGIITFNTFGAKQIIRDLGKVLGISNSIIDELAKSSEDTLKESLNKPNFKRLIDNYFELKKLYNIALPLEGLPRHISMHAAGIIMCKEDIDNIIPLYKNQLGMYVTGYSMNYLESLGLLKMDFLGISNLSLIDNVINMINKNEKLNVTFNNIPLNDKKTLELFAKGNTDGIFQFESTGMKNFIQKLKIDSFDDVIASISLYRPGPMDNIDTYIKRKQGKEKITYIDPSLESILKDTYGIIIYQEQIMQIAVKMAGYTLGEADVLRRAMSKKKEEILIKEKDKFINKSIEKGHTKEVAKNVYEMILKFANYGFNKSHAVSYSIIAYKMAFLKTYFYKYFMTSLLTNAINNENKTNTYILELRKNKEVIITPDINISTNEYIVYNKKIVCPLSIIRNVGTNTTFEILKERENGPYKSFIDFLKRTSKRNINKKTIINLIYAGCFNNFSYNKKTLINNLDSILNYVELSEEDGIVTTLEPIIDEFNEYTKEDLIEGELNVFGFYLSEHPVSKYKNDNTNTLMIEKNFNKYISLTLIINHIKEINTKNNDIMAFVEASDEYSKVDLTIFPKDYKKYNNIKEKDIIRVYGRVEKRYEKFQIIVSKIEVLNR